MYPQGHTARPMLSQMGWRISYCPGGHQVGRKPCLTGSLCVQKHKKAKKPYPTSRPMSHQHVIGAWNASTALFISGGQWSPHPRIQRRGTVVLETPLMWTFKAQAEWGVPWNWAGRQGGWVAGPRLTPGGDVGWWGLTRACQGEYRKGD